MEMTPVTSSQIESVAHDPTTGTLHVKFSRGGHYTYPNVTPEQYADFLTAPSKGKWLGANIKSNPKRYPHTKL